VVGLAIAAAEQVAEAFIGQPTGVRWQAHNPSGRSLASITAS
jgi:hypothetical protein